MSEYRAEVMWERGEQPFVDNRYSRRHRLRFDGGAEVAGSSSPHVVPLPMSDAAAVDPEEAFVAALASCHMLFFLGHAAKGKFRVDRYRDDALGVLAKDAAGRMSMTEVTLNPVVEFSGDRRPTQTELDALHHRSHADCYIANSVRTEVRCNVQRL
jgi:organic hydroperoxide reductase OsmC/OhrA